MPQRRIQFVIAISSIVVLLVSGTIVYHFIEDWSWVDSFYFTGTTLTTVGYGDLYPSHDISKLFSVLLAFTGITVVFYSVSIIATDYFQSQQEKLMKRLSMLERRSAKEAQKTTILEQLGSKRNRPLVLKLKNRLTKN